MKHDEQPGWDKIRFRTPAEIASRIAGSYLCLIGQGTDRAHAVLLSEPDDPESVVLDIEQEGGRAPVRMHGDDAAMAEYLIALGWAQLLSMGREPFPGIGSTLLAEMTGEIAQIHVPEGLRQMTVDATVFNRPVRTTVMATSNVGALMMAAHKAAAEALTHPYSTVRNGMGGRTGETLPLHPQVLGGRRICADPVRNSNDEPWTWTNRNAGPIEVERTEILWSDESADMALRGWYIALYDSAGDPVELIGGIAHEARQVLLCLDGAMPAGGGWTEAGGPDLSRAAAVALNALEGRTVKEGDTTPAERRCDLIEQIRNHEQQPA